MIRINELKINTEQYSEKVLIHKICKKLNISEDQLSSYQIIKRSIDARKKPVLFFVFTVDCVLNCLKESKIISRKKDNHISVSEEKKYQFPYQQADNITLKNRPVIIGTGPAGLFCGYFLASHGFKPILLERGETLEKRKLTVEKFWETGLLNPDSNIQFGEGGAGTFSDGKLNTLVKDSYGRNKEVLKLFIKHGADPQIMYDYKAHLGTDELIKIVDSMRNEMIHMGAEFYFDSKVTDFLVKNNRITGVTINHTQQIACKYLVIACGHSARDTFPELLKSGCEMEAKDFAVGLRVIHPQSLIDYSQYGTIENEKVGASPYKLVGNVKDGHNIYSFCMCPGGYVVNASSEEGYLAVNGMSYSGRDSGCANSAIVMTVNRDNYPDQGPLSGIFYQRELERRAYLAGNNVIPIETFQSFENEVSKNNTDKSNDFNKDMNHFFDHFVPCIKGQYHYASVSSILPEDLNKQFVEGMHSFGRKIKGFDHPDVIIAGIESRTSSPVRIKRDDNKESNIKGIFPCGEGAGYAGGITSAAMDGIVIAEAVAKKMLEYQ